MRKILFIVLCCHLSALLYGQSVNDDSARFRELINKLITTDRCQFEYYITDSSNNNDIEISKGAACRDTIYYSYISNRGKVEVWQEQKTVYTYYHDKARVEIDNISQQDIDENFLNIFTNRNTLLEKRYKIVKRIVAKDSSEVFELQDIKNGNFVIFRIIPHTKSMIVVPNTQENQFIVFKNIKPLIGDIKSYFTFSPKIKENKKRLKYVDFRNI